MKETNLLPVLTECANRLGSVVQSIESALSKPIITDVSGQRQYRYEQHTPYHIAFLKGVRIVSGLIACLFLLKEKGGFAQEVMVIVRTLDDFTGEMMFILENAESDTLTNHQEKFLKDFFQEEFVNPNNPLLNEARRDTVPKKNVWASVARQMAPYANQSDLQKMLQVTNDALSGYAHGAYPHIMEMFCGRPTHFHFEGMSGTTRIPMCIQQLEIYTHRAIMAFNLLAKNLGLAALSEFLLETRDYLEKEVGYDQPGDLNKDIRSLKKRR
jgi:hypothetical protein